MRRKAVRTFPGNRHVALYYIQQLDKYVSVPVEGDTKDLGALNMSESYGQYNDNGTYVIHHNKHNIGGAYPSAPGSPKPWTAFHAHQEKHYETHHDSHAEAVREVIKHHKRDGLTEEPLAELSAPKLQAYKAAAATDAQTNPLKTDDDKRTFGNRVKGLIQSTHRLKEEVITEAKKAKKKKAKKKVKGEPYDFWKHLRDVAKAKPEKHKPLRFDSGERQKINPEAAEILAGIHGKLNLYNQARMKKMMRSGRKGFDKALTFAYGNAARVK